MIEVAERIKTVQAYYFVKKLEQIRDLKAQGHHVINFGIGSPDLPPSQDVIDSLSETANQSNSHGYQPYAGTLELKESIALWYKDTYNCSFELGEVLPLMGSKEGILHTTLAFVNPGDNVLIPNPGYPTYKSLSTLLGAEVRNYNLEEKENWQPNIKEIESLIDNKTKLVWINYPHMPTGTPPNKEILKELIDLCRRKNVMLCHDNPYSLVLNQESPFSIYQLTSSRENILEFNSLSKSHNMAGWRIGMLLGKEEYIKSILRVKSNIDSGMFLGLQNAAAISLTEDNLFHKERNEVYLERRKLVEKIFDLLEVDYDPNQVGMFLWGKPKHYKTPDEIESFLDKCLSELKIFFTPGKIFGTNGESYIRASLCVNVKDISIAYERLSTNTVNN